MPFGPVKQNEETTLEKFKEEGCNSKHSETDERCGETRGTPLIKGPAYILWLCSKCSIATPLVSGEVDEI